MAGATQARAAVQAAQAKGEELTEEKIAALLGPVQQIAARYDAMARTAPSRGSSRRELTPTVRARESVMRSLPPNTLSLKMDAKLKSTAAES